VIQTAKADVIGPAVTSDDPDALVNQGISDRQEVLNERGRVCRLRIL
jgi:hypothetical protein